MCHPREAVRCYEPLAATTSGYTAFGLVIADAF